MLGGRFASLVILTAIVSVSVWILFVAYRRWWSSRGREGHWIVRRVFLVLGTIVILYWVALPIALALVATKSPGAEAVALDLGDKTREVKLRTGDGLTLAGSYVPSQNGMAVVTFPSREATAGESKMLANRGYGVLALDMRGEGGSGGDRNAYGWGAAADLRAGVDFLTEQESVRKVGGLGLSVGGEQLIEAAAGDQRIGAVASEGAGERSVREMLIRGPAAALAIPRSFVLTTAVAAITGEQAPPALDDLAAEISPRGLLLIHAEDGSGGEELNVDYFAAAGEPKSLWTLPSGGHTGGFVAEPDEYERRVTKLFESQLNPDF